MSINRLPPFLPTWSSGGLLEEHVVLFGSEFGRLPMAQGQDGRDHNITGYSMFLAGGGREGGYTHGATDEFGGEGDRRSHAHQLTCTRPCSR
jgi:hypothetical protein